MPLEEATVQAARQACLHSQNLRCVLDTVLLGLDIVDGEPKPAGSAKQLDEQFFTACQRRGLWVTHPQELLNAAYNNDGILPDQIYRFRTSILALRLQGCQDPFPLEAKRELTRLVLATVWWVRFQTYRCICVVHVYKQEGRRTQCAPEQSILSSEVERGLS